MKFFLRRHFGKDAFFGVVGHTLAMSLPTNGGSHAKKIYDVWNGAVFQPVFLELPGLEWRRIRHHGRHP